MKKGASKEELLQQDHVQHQVKTRAYLIAEAEGFPHGRDIIHWLRAEEEIVVEFFGKQLKTATAAAKSLRAKAAASTAQARAEAIKPAPKRATKAVAKPAPKAAVKAASKPAAKAAAPTTNGKAKKATSSKPAKKN